MSFFPWKTQLKLARSLITKTSPAYVQYYITARCDLTCEQCNIIYAQADSPEMDIGQIRAMAENLAEIGVCIVLLIGGEPFVRKDLPEIIRAFTANGIHVRMQTNGLATEEMLSRCIEAGGHDISISLDSLDPMLQDTINVRPKSWQRAIRTVSMVNRIFPENGAAFFGTVLMPRNLEHIPDVLEFATEIGWGVSLVPVHTSSPDRPRGFRTLDLGSPCIFSELCYPRVKEVLQVLKTMRDGGMNLYDSDEYLDDIYRFIAGQPLEWRRRNFNVCDSPSLYFAIEPNGSIQPCCDYKLPDVFPIYDKRFVSLYRSGEIHKKVHPFTQSCDGCMYGSYPEITISTRYLKPLIHRFLYFSGATLPALKKLSEPELSDLAQAIYDKHETQRRARDPQAHVA